MSKKLSKERVAELARGWVKGDKESFSIIYDTLVDNIYKFIYFKVHSRDAEDLTELVFIKAWENRKKYDHTKSSFTSWLYTIARNTVIDHYRVSKQVDQLDTAIEDDKKRSNPKKLTEEVLNATTMRKAVEKLPKNYRDVVLLRFIQDMSYSEIAQTLDKTEGAIRIMQFRALRQLKQILKDDGFNSNNL